MCSSAPRLERRFLRAIARLDDPSVSMAETNRRVRALAEQLGVPRPSYERVRQHLKETRRAKAERRRKREILVDVALYTRPVDDLRQLVD